MQLGHELAIARGIAREVGAMIMSARAHSLEVSAKAGGEIVTNADLAANELIEQHLRECFPDDAVYSEERPDDSRRLTKRRVWIVDPIDSTSSFVRGADEFCVSIGLAVHRAAVLGVVYNPAREEMYCGTIGAGVTLNGARVRVTDAASLVSASILVSTKEWNRGLRGPFSFSVKAVSSMAYKLARVAAGQNDGVFTLKRRKEWGTCAGVALVCAAGGCVSLLDTSAVHFNRSELKQPRGFVASGPKMHAALLEYVGKLQVPAANPHGAAEVLA